MINYCLQGCAVGVKDLTPTTLHPSNETPMKKMQNEDLYIKVTGSNS
jgi:hypothetical protein